MSTGTLTSPFATSETTAAEVAALIKEGVQRITDTGAIDWKGMPDAVRPFNVANGSLPIGYSRAWLIVRHAWLAANQPTALVTLPTPTEAQVAAVVKFLADKGDTKTNAKVMATNRAWAKVVGPMRDAQMLSWGEISVRCGVPESKVRACYRATGSKKDLGLRINKGGRFAYGEPEFYLEHRRAEGAMIPADLTGKPKVEQLINAANAEGKVVKAIRSNKKAPAAKSA